MAEIRTALMQKIKRMWSSQDTQMKALGTEIWYASYPTYEEWNIIRSPLVTASEEYYYDVLWEQNWQRGPHPNNPKYAKETVRENKEDD